MPFEASWMPLLENVGMLYGKSGGMPLCQEFTNQFLHDSKGLGLCC
jgi:hypothetical protein